MVIDVDARTAHWHVLWTRSNCEQLVHDQLTAKGFHVLLPRVRVWSRQRGARRLARVPMFPAYLFLRHAMDKQSYVEVRKARGLVEILGGPWDRLLAVPDAEVSAIERVDRAQLPGLPHPYLRQGQRVRITAGPLVDVEGLLLRANASKGLLLLSVHLLHRTIAVEVDCTHAVPV